MPETAALTTIDKDQISPSYSAEKVQGQKLHLQAARVHLVERESCNAPRVNVKPGVAARSQERPEENVVLNTERNAHQPDNEEKNENRRSAAGDGPGVDFQHFAVEDRIARHM